MQPGIISAYSGLVKLLAPPVNTRDGAVQGLIVDNVRSYRGIPYGVAQRWAAPNPVKWDGEWNATEYGHVAPQTTYTWKDTVVGDEDCLNLDIVRPDTDEQLPVVVYFHGGGYFSGASHTAVLRGYNFASEMNAVYVAPNFRLGVLGYTNMAASDLPGAEDCVPTPAVLDQLLVLKWVRRNIAAFGGDPNRVTLMGESAGGAAVSTLMSVPAAEGLFRGAIVQSAPVMGMHSVEQARSWARRAVEFAGEVPRRTSIAELRRIPVSDLVRAGQQMMWRGGGLRELNMCFAPTVDGEVIPDHPLTLFQEGAQHRVPLLIGTNNDELSAAQLLYVFKQSRAAAARTMLNAHDALASQSIEAAYGNLGTRAGFATMLSDAIFWAQSVRLAELHSRVSAVWMYRFDYVPALLRRLGIGAMHSMELSAIFGDAQGSKARLLLGPELQEVTLQMQQEWRAFIWGESVGWPQYAVDGAADEARATRVFERTVHTVHDPRRAVREAWANFDLSGWDGDEATLLRPRPGR